MNIDQKLTEFMTKCEALSNSENEVTVFEAATNLKTLKDEISAEFQFLKDVIKDRDFRLIEFDAASLQEMIKRKELERELGLLKIELTHTKTLLSSAEKALGQRDAIINAYRFPHASKT